MKKISKADIEVRTALVKRLTEAFLQLNSAVEEFNAAMADEYSKIDDAQNAYNEVLSEAIDWRDNIVTEIESYIDERSDKWREGEKAQNYESWKSEYEALDFSESQISAPDELSVEVEDVTEAIEQLPEEVEE